ncbi:MAG TPA: metallophosphoesterase [Candidatus Pacearchaeota archaeon]|nr:metallophosphoesterase [Candidatus Pacearchaeota archaeon]
MKIKKENKSKDFTFISKTLFFPKQGILVIGDLHLGYDEMIKEQGINLLFDQLEETKKELEIIIKRIKALYTLKKIILLGDIKHHFQFQKKEIFDLRNFLKFLERYLPKENIILIKGNHDTFTLKDYKLEDYYLYENLAFTHGEQDFPELFRNKNIITIVTSHIHPAVLIKDKINIKREKYKCFLVGKYKKKQFIILPSFFSIIEGSEISEYKKGESYQQLIPKNKLKSFETYVVGRNSVYYFGKYGKLNN